MDPALKKPTIRTELDVNIIKNYSMINAIMYIVTNCYEKHRGKQLRV